MAVKLNEFERVEILPNWSILNDAWLVGSVHLSYDDFRRSSD